MDRNAEYTDLEILEEYIGQIGNEFESEEGENEDIIANEELEREINETEENESDTANDELEHEVKFFNSAKGGSQISYDGFLFCRDNSIKAIEYFKCVKTQLGCKARIVVRNDENGSRTIYPSKAEHCHQVRPLKSAVEVSLSNLREISITDGSRPCQILNEFHATPENKYLNPLMPSKNALRNRIDRARRKNSDRIPPEPTNLNFEYDRIFCSLNNEYIVLNDWTSADGLKKVTIFSTSKLFNFLCESDIWLCDGTFQTCPKMFYQLFIIHGNLPGDLYVAYPMVFVLLSGKSTEIYDVSLELLEQSARQRRKTFKFTHALFDFEKAIANAFISRYPHVNFTGCQFHLDQIIMKQVKANNFSRLYTSDHRFHIEIACLMALAYLPPEEIHGYFNELFPTMCNQSKKIASWFKTNYIEGNNGRRPRYSPNFWSIYANFAEGFPTTQNWAESYHHHIHSILDAERQPVYKFIAFLKNEFSSILCDVDKYLCGKPQKHRMPGYERNTNSINLILNRRNVIPHVETLKSLVYVKDNLRP